MLRHHVQVEASRFSPKHVESICWQCSLRLAQRRSFSTDVASTGIGRLRIGAQGTVRASNKYPAILQRSYAGTVDRVRADNDRVRPLPLGTWPLACNNPLASHKIDTARQSQSRGLTTSASLLAAGTQEINNPQTEAPPHDASPTFKRSSIRERLREWEIKRAEEVELLRAEQGTSAALANANLVIGNIFAGQRPFSETLESELVTHVDASDGLAETHSNLGHMEHGDMVELLLDERNVLAIFIRRFRTQSQFYTIDGRWLHRIDSSSYFIVRKFFNPEELRPILPYFPDTEIPQTALDEIFPMSMDIPRTFAAPLISKMVEFQTEANEIYRRNAASIDSAYDQIAHSNRFNLWWISLDEIASKVLRTPAKKLSKPALWAVHRAILFNEVGLIPDMSRHWYYSEFAIRSAQEVELLKRMQVWFYHYLDHCVAERSKENTASEAQATTRNNRRPEAKSTVIQDFVERARSIILESRKFRNVATSGGIGPTLIQAVPIQKSFNKRPVATKSVKIGEFQESDTDILRFFELWCIKNTILKQSPLFVIGPRILRAIGLYDGFDELSMATGLTMLQELGYITPWENIESFHPKLALPGTQPDPVTEKLLVDAAQASRDFTPVDRMSEFRRDWGEIEVFCVDRLEAHEIDDGFSLETVPGDETCYWIHSHIANPTAFIPPESNMSKYAARLVESVYLPEKTYFMLPPHITGKHFSLDSDRPVLTFSAKVNRKGEILDYKITPGTIRKVTFLTPETLQEVLRPKDLGALKIGSFEVGHNPAPAAVPSRNVTDHNSLDQTQVDILQTLLELSRATRSLREKKGALFIAHQNKDIQVYYDEPGLPYRKTIRRIEGDPTITYQTRGFDTEFSPERSHYEDVDLLVADIMLITGQVAGNWCADRNIPALFRGQSSDPTLPNPEEFKATILSKPGGPTWQDKKDLVFLYGHSTVSIEQTPHGSLGLNAYCKVTSPLRRYGDMLVHWQIESAIREEARSQRPVDAARSDKFLAFKKSHFNSIIPWLKRNEILVHRAKHNSVAFWVLMMVYRHFYHGQNMGLPEVFNVYIDVPRISRNLNEPYLGLVKELDLRCTIVLPKTSNATDIIALAPGQWWTASILSVDLYDKKLRVKLIALKK